MYYKASTRRRTLLQAAPPSPPNTKENTMSNALTTLSSKLATKFGMEAESEVLATLKATAFKGQVSDAQMTALLIVANQYGLNPWTKEIYAFPDQNNGIVPVVGVDGWSRIMNDHPQFDGMEFEQDDESCTCKIYRKDRSHPIEVTEYLSECKREVKPWKSHPKRMLRHKAMIQCARLAFGFVGIYDEDEAARIRETDITPKKDPVSIAQQAAQVEHDDKTLSLIADLEIVAKEHGKDAYEASWKGLTKEQRQAVGAAKHEELKALCNVIDMETGEIA